MERTNTIQLQLLIYHLFIEQLDNSFYDVCLLYELRPKCYTEKYKKKNRYITLTPSFHLYFLYLTCL